MKRSKAIVRRACERRTDLGLPECSEPWVFSEAGVRGGWVLPPAPRERWCSACLEGKFVSPLLFALVELRWQLELAHVCRMMADRQGLGIPIGNHAVRAEAQVEHIGWWRSTWGAR